MQVRAKSASIGYNSTIRKEGMAMAKNDTTSTELAHTQRASEAAAKAFELDPHLINLLWEEPFFSHILRQITKVRSESIPTAGVLAKDGDIKMWYNPRFVAALPSKHIKGLLKHECYHLVFEHTTTRRHEPHLVWNYATDLAINSLIPEEELPEGGLVPGKEFKALSEADKIAMGPDRVKQFETVSAKIASFPKEKSAEWYFAELMADDEVQEALTNPAPAPGQPGDGEGEGQPGDGQPGQPGQGQPAPGLPGTMDSHDGWDELSDEDRELIKGKVKQAVEDAVKKCDQSGQWGSVGASGQSMIRELISKEIPWQSVLKKFCGMTRRANRASNVRRIHRKYPGVHPGFQKGYTSSIAVYIDQSGSVSDEDLSLLFGELKQLAKKTKFTIFNFDTEVDESSEREWGRNRAPGMERTRYGGTDFRAATVHANKNRHRFDGYLILTDGECCDPGPSILKRGWVITPDRKLYFEASKRDFLIQMKGKKAA
tara:strand:- start:48974 stop:50431 length:1458 start_codon:yes stop_codon:yes gene_type:complete